MAAPKMGQNATIPNIPFPAAYNASVAATNSGGA